MIYLRIYIGERLPVQVVSTVAHDAILFFVQEVDLIKLVYHGIFELCKKRVYENC